MRDSASKVKRRKGKRRPGQVLLRDRAVYALFRAAAFLIRRLPPETASDLMGSAWRFFGPRTNRQQTALANLALALPERGPADHKRIAADHWENLGRTFSEAFHIDRIAADPTRVVLRPNEALSRRLAEPGGIVMASMHSANWELMPCPFRRSRALAGLYKPNTNPLINEFLLRNRRPLFEGGLFGPGHQTAAQVMRWVRNGNGVGMLSDHHEGAGVKVVFFGHKAKASPFPALIARRLKTPLFAARVIRFAHCRFEIEAVEVPVPVTADREADIAEATQALHRQLESWIRERPGEWLWQQRRWRGRRRRSRPADAAH